MSVQTQLFNSNSIYVYFLSCIVIFNYQHFSKHQKISLIYATTIAMELISQYNWSLTAVMLLTSMFILEEYLSDDKVKCELLSNIWYKILDFVYQFFVLDAGLWITINIVVSGKWLRDVITDKIPVSIFYGINIFILFVTIHILNTSKFELFDFGVIKSYFDKFDGKKIDWNNCELQKRFDVMVELEDKSYFERENSYNWFSMEFVKYKVNSYRERREWQKQLREKKSLRKMFRSVWYLIKRFRLFRYIIKKITDRISQFGWTVSDFFTRLNRKIRGCSTLEMQLIRNIGIKKGYDECVIRRKFFELFYTYLFFSGLKSYYQSTRNAKRKELKKYILYVYLHSIKLKMFGNEFKTIANLFDKEKVEEWDIDEFYIAILSLTGATVTPKRMVLYPRAVVNCGIDLNRALVWRNMIQDGQITETEKKPFCENDVQQVFFIIGGAILPYVEDGTFYGPDDWPSYGEQNCWSFARSVYWHIWWEGFSNRTGTDDDMMREYHSLADRTITEEHCKKYFGQAEPGAVIRICDDIKGNDRMGKNKHSQILLQRDECGVTIYESNDSNTSIAYYTWEQYVQKYGKYKYFKYIKWPQIMHSEM